MFWRNAAASILSMLFLSGLVYFGIRWILGDDAIAKTLAGLPLLAVKNLYEFLEKRQVLAEIEKRHINAIPQQADFSVPWLSLTIQGILAYCGLILVSTGIAGFSFGLAAGATKIASPMPPGFHLFAAIPMYFIGVYIFGMWLGTRSGRYGYLSLIVAAVTANFLLRELEIIVANNYDAYRQSLIIQEVADWTQFFKNFAQAAVGMIFILPCAFLGFFVGKRRRNGRYFAFILSVLPQETRSLLIGIAHEEASSLALRKAKPTPAP